MDCLGIMLVLASVALSSDEIMALSLGGQLLLRVVLELLGGAYYGYCLLFGMLVGSFQCSPCGCCLDQVVSIKGSVGAWTVHFTCCGSLVKNNMSL